MQNCAHATRSHLLKRRKRKNVDLEKLLDPRSLILAVVFHFMAQIRAVRNAPPKPAPPPDLPSPPHASRSRADHPAAAFAAPSPRPTVRASKLRAPWWW